jgi:hypothetical protein
MAAPIELIHTFIQDELSSIAGVERASLTPDTPLLGSGSPLKSRELVELLLAVEEFAEDRMGVRFDWTSDKAMSEAHSLFRTVGSLADHLAGLQRA